MARLSRLVRSLALTRASRPDDRTSFGYLTGDIPASYIMQRVSLVKYFSCACMLWGLVVACTAACRSFASMAILRLILGYLEVCTAPAAIMITASWYTKEEQVLRVSLWYTTSGWAVSETSPGLQFAADSLVSAASLRRSFRVCTESCKTLQVGRLVLASWRSHFLDRSLLLILVVGDTYRSDMAVPRRENRRP